MTAAGLERLNQSSPEEAYRDLLRCCGSTQWAHAMVAKRPFRSFEELTIAAENQWQQAEEKDLLEAFQAHPRIGGKGSLSSWSQAEQAGANAATDAAQREMADLNDQYFEKFGFVFLICATGKSHQEMLQSLRARMGADREEELATAAKEQAKITRLRLEKLLC